MEAVCLFAPRIDASTWIVGFAIRDDAPPSDGEIET